MPDYPIVIRVRGVPKPGGSKRGFVINGRAVLVDASGKKGKDWRGDCRAAALAAMGSRPPFDGPLAVSFSFTMPRPKHHYRSNGQLKPNAPVYHTSKPDATKLVRSIEDALTPLAWTDDSRIVIQHATKLYGDEPGAVVEVREIK